MSEFSKKNKAAVESIIDEKLSKDPSCKLIDLNFYSGLLSINALEVRAIVNRMKKEGKIETMKVGKHGDYIISRLAGTISVHL
jgi:DNA-binding transcriptional regulator PaaX